MTRAGRLGRRRTPIAPAVLPPSLSEGKPLTMTTHIVLAHPEPNSFNAHLAATSHEALSAAGSPVTQSDLYGLDFDPCEGPRHYRVRKDAAAFHTQTEQRYSADHAATPADVEREIARLLGCDLLVVHFPLWWFGAPAILKGWMDRVFVYGRLYRSALRYDRGVCAGKRMIACVTTGASAASCAHNGREGDTRLHLWPILFPFRYLGFRVYEPEVFHGVGGVAFIEEQEDGLSALETHTRQWRAALATLSERPFVRYNADDDFDETKRLVPGAPVYAPFIRHTP